MTEIQKKDYELISNLEYINWTILKDKNILITGSTGLIGSNLTNCLLYVSDKYNLNIRCFLAVRNIDSATEMYADYLDKLTIFRYELGDILEIDEHIDYIVHSASPTSSKDFSEHPVDVLEANIFGTKALLDFAKDNQIEKFIYLSSMEVYGFPKKGQKVNESFAGAFDSMKERNSYPISKIACESLLHSYYKQYSVSGIVLRLTQTFGPGVKYNDGRVFAEFMRCVIENRDIVLKTKGLTERPYLYTADAVSAIIVGMLYGESGEAYSVANPDTYCSISEMANLVVDKLTNNKISVVINEETDLSKFGYAETLYMDLNTTKIEKLGWNPNYNLSEMFECAISDLRFS